MCKFQGNLCAIALLSAGIGCKQIICVVAVVLGFSLASIPQILGFDGSTSNPDTGETEPLAYRILWPLCFVASFVPYACNTVIVEKMMKTEKVTHLLLKGSLTLILMISLC